jgi:hypothetical protein
VFGDYQCKSHRRQITGQEGGMVATTSMHDGEYAQKRAVLESVRHAMLADRLRFSVVQVRLREAAIEQAEEQVAYLEEREAALGPVVTAAARRVADLAAEVERLRMHTLADGLEQTITDLSSAVRAIETHVRQVYTDIQTALGLAERAQRYADSLPTAYLRERVATNETSGRLRAMDELVRLLVYLLGEQEPS